MGACINGKLQLIRETSRSAAAAATAAADCAADAARAVLLQVFNQFLMKSKIAIDLFSWHENALKRQTEHGKCVYIARGQNLNKGC